MFEVGDIIFYGNNGVCKVISIGKLDMAGANEDRVYYTLQPCYTKGSTIFTPVDNPKVLMRPVLTKSEALQMIDEIKDIDAVCIQDEKGREAEYKEAVQKCDCRELIKIIKTIYLRKQKRLAEDKKVTAVDEKYFKMAEENLYGELAVSLGMTKEDVKDYITDRVDSLTVS